MTETWTVEQCADHWSITSGTWKGYVSRQLAPPPIGYDASTGRRVWDAKQVRSRKPGAKWTANP